MLQEQTRSLECIHTLLLLQQIPPPLNFLGHIYCLETRQIHVHDAMLSLQMCRQTQLIKKYLSFTEHEVLHINLQLSSTCCHSSNISLTPEKTSKMIPLTKIHGVSVSDPAGHAIGPPLTTYHYECRSTIFGR
jgi:hypothetical protein